MLRVKAEDQGTPKLSAFVTVTISITDRNSNPPTWDSNTYEREYEVKETAPIAHVITSMTAQSNTPAPLDGVSFGLINEFENTVQQLGPFRIQQQGDLDAQERARLQREEQIRAETQSYSMMCVNLPDVHKQVLESSG